MRRLFASFQWTRVWAPMEGTARAKGTSAGMAIPPGPAKGACPTMILPERSPRSVLSTFRTHSEPLLRFTTPQRFTVIPERYACADANGMRTEGRAGSSGFEHTERQSILCFGSSYLLGLCPRGMETDVQAVAQPVVEIPRGRTIAASSSDVCYEFPSFRNSKQGW